MDTAMDAWVRERGKGPECRVFEFRREREPSLTMAPNTMYSILPSLSSEVPSSDDRTMRVMLCR